MPKTIEYGRAAHFKLPLRWILLIFIGCVGLILLWYSIPQIYKCFQARNWPSVPGRVSGKGTESHADSLLSPSRYTHLFSTSDNVDVAYDYMVNGVQYSSSTVSCDDGRQVEVALLQPIGSDVTVYYEPSDPSNAVINRTVGPSTLSVTLVGVVLVCFSSFSFFFARNKNGKNSMNVVES